MHDQIYTVVQSVTLLLTLGAAMLLVAWGRAARAIPLFIMAFFFAAMVGDAPREIRAILFYAGLWALLAIYLLDSRRAVSFLGDRDGA